ncbi:DUF2589 domain-containing protein [Parachryseolinea silvisoli]|jgi:hypothetical protein|uniref:DUF2589 domain-containing protein n=1 Tax=Parachryseolinea silvisoli TaxID=2873601 RepID=UPI0022659E2C|nr:DUF2589 domain-containing protein [Parachryseolinea silvisoli]MCD9017577.1 DUF2589 domain-containing protein [Parachryseolinea silvisoli]
MADGDINVSPAEFQKIPLDFIIATPLLTTINAHRQAAETTLAFITKLLNKPADGNGPGGVDNLQFKMKVNEVDSTGKSVQVEREISVPLITLVKVPSLNFDSMSVSFNYNISQISKEVNTNAQSAKLDIGTTGILKGFFNASLVGSVEHSRTRETTSNRGGTLEVKVNVSESQLPAGLQKILDALVENIELPK